MEEWVWKYQIIEKQDENKIWLGVTTDIDKPLAKEMDFIANDA